MRTILSQLAPLALLLLGACDGGSTETSADVQPTATTETVAPTVSARERAARRERAGTGGHGPRIQFDSDHYDFGLITDTQVYTTSFSFTNTGTSPLRIREVKAECGCTLPTLEKYVYEPGEQGTIAVEFDPKGRKGRSVKSITVISNAIDAGLVKLTFDSSIKPLFALDGKFLRFGLIDLGQPRIERMNARYTDPDLSIESVSVFRHVDVHEDTREPVPYISARVVEEGVPEAGPGGLQQYRSTIEVMIDPSMPWGSLNSVRLEVLVNGTVEGDLAPITFPYMVFLQGYAFGELHATSASRGRRPVPMSMLSIGKLGPNARFQPRLTINRPSGASFTVLNVSVEDTTIPNVNVRFEQKDSSTWDVILTGTTGNYVGEIRGEVVVQTDVPGEEELRLRFMGLAG